MATHILVVERKGQLARFIKLEVHSTNYQVNVARDGASGLAAVQKANPDLLVFDWELPGLAGVELCQHLQAAGNPLPVILLTADDEISNQMSTQDTGADAYLDKPFSTEELLVQVHSLLTGSLQHPISSTDSD